MSDHAEKIREYIEANKQNILDDLFVLMKIDSSYDDSTLSGEKPFGAGSAEALGVCRKMLEGYGFATENYDNYVITADLGGGDRELDILAHLDVVPGGEGWKITDAFTPLIDGGRVYGRGSADDKGPAIAAIYALKAIKDLNVPLKKNVRLILGGCEELGMGDLEYYFERQSHAKYSFSPDADYPLINAERGIFGTEFNKKFTEKECAASCIVSIDAGLRRNMVPAKAKAVFRGADGAKLGKAAGNAAKRRGAGIELTNDGETSELTVYGVGGHASTPDSAVNSLLVLLEIISEAAPCDDPVAGFLKNVSKVYPFGSYHGEAAGIDIEDEESGRISSSLNVMKFGDGILTAIIDSRVPASGNDENFVVPLKNALTAAGADNVVTAGRPCHLVPESSPFVRKLLDSYRRITGDCAGPFAIGGGTYVHEIENGVAFGCAMPGVDNRMHGPDEFMELDVLFKSIQIFADAVISICG